MELTAETIGQLRDEAYTALCRRAITEALENLDRERAAIESTRPPFALLARRQTRDAFTQSMTVVHRNTAALQVRLAEVDQIAQFLRDLLRPALHDYLGALDQTYRRFPFIRRAISDWEIACQLLPDLFVAFARDARVARQECGCVEPPHRDRVPLLALRDAALRLEQQLDKLDEACQRLAALLPAGAENELCLPPTPSFRFTAWVALLPSLPAAQLVAEVSQTENLVRQHYSEQSASIAARLAASRELCDRYEREFLEHYWNQLRTHAQLHYVEEREIDDVIEELSQRYITSDLARRQRELAAADHQFLG
jgi:hypothetical protein